MAERTAGPKSPEQIEAVLDGRAKGGVARAEALSKEQRRSIAQAAALSRWHGEIPKATHEGILTIGEFSLQCAVLEGGRRVLSEMAVYRALGISVSGAAYQSALVDEVNSVRLPLFVGSANLRPFIDNELHTLLTKPIMYRPHKGGRQGRGVDAILIPKVCEVWLRARDAGALRANQLKTAARADTLMRGLARTGIIALVDEATGYQEVRDRHALQAILDAYLRKEFAAWAKRFPDEYFHEIFRLRGWEWDELRKKQGKAQGPRVIAKYTKDIVYARLAPGILEELQDRNPPDDKGRRKTKHHQWLTEDVGHPALAQHLHAVIALMRASDTWEQFQKLLKKALPMRTDLGDLPLFNQPVASIAAGPVGSLADSHREKAS